MKNSNIQFIIKAKKIHGNRYNYSNINYTNSRTKVEIICPIHGVFHQTPHHHISRKQGCSKCGYNRSSSLIRKTTQDFIKEAKKIHGDKYDYLLVKYNKSKSRVKIICPIHGEFEQTPDNHLQGNNCGKCIGLHTSKIEFTKVATSKHNGKYNYSLVNFTNKKTKIEIICPTHGIFQQMPYAHLFGQGCPICIGKNKTTEKFIEEAKLIHGDKYNYSLIEYKHSKEKVIIECLKHGQFKQTPNMHLKGNGCPICKESKGEKQIRIFLIRNNITYKSQHKFNNCRNVQELPFDFYLPNLNICIEYDRIQHFKPINKFGGVKGYDKLKNNDNIKTEYCLKNNIKLLRIPYYNNVDDSLTNFLTNK